MIIGIILAAGASSRMGRPKALLPVAPGGPPFVVHLARTIQAAGVEDVIVVVGANGGAIIDLLEREIRTIRVVENLRPELGQLSSLVAGLEVADRPGVGAVLVTPVDQPLVAADTVRVLVETYRRTGAAFVRPAREGRHGHPVVIDRRLFAELRSNPVTGARDVIRRHVAEGVDVEVTDDGAFADIDTPEDYARHCGGVL